jgi:hypothetical protein
LQIYKPKAAKPQRTRQKQNNKKWQKSTRLLRGFLEFGVLARDALVGLAQNPGNAALYVGGCHDPRFCGIIERVRDASGDVFGKLDGAAGPDYAREQLFQAERFGFPVFLFNAQAHERPTPFTANRRHEELKTGL